MTGFLVHPLVAMYLHLDYPSLPLQVSELSIFLSPPMKASPFLVRSAPWLRTAVDSPPLPPLNQPLTLGCYGARPDTLLYIRFPHYYPRFWIFYAFSIPRTRLDDCLIAPSSPVCLFVIFLNSAYALVYTHALFLHFSVLPPIVPSCQDYISFDLDDSQMCIA